MRESLKEDIERVVERTSTAVGRSLAQLGAISANANAANSQLRTAYESLRESRVAIEAADRLLGQNAPPG